MLAFALRYGSVWSHKSLSIDYSPYGENPLLFRYGKGYVRQTKKDYKRKIIYDWK